MIQFLLGIALIAAGVFVGRFTKKCKPETLESKGVCRARGILLAPAVVAANEENDPVAVFPRNQQVEIVARREWYSDVGDGDIEEAKRVAQSACMVPE